MADFLLDNNSQAQNEIVLLDRVNWLNWSSPINAKNQYSF
jgi:hypothetical protein